MQMKRTDYSEIALRAWRFTVRQENVRVLLVCGLALLGLSLAVNKSSYIILRIVGWIALIGMLPCFLKLHWRDCPLGLAAAVLFGVYVLITPGDWFADYKLGWRILIPLFIGVTMPFLLQQGMHILTVSIAVFLSVLFGYALLSGGEWGFAEDRLCLRFGHPNVLAPLLAWLLLFFIQFRAKTRRLRWLIIALSVPCLVMLVLTNSRTSQLAFAIAAVFLLLRCFEWRKAAGLLLAGALCMGLVHMQLPDKLYKRTIDSVQNVWEEPTFLSRQPIWEVTLAGILEEPLLGRSMKVFPSYYAAYIEEHSKQLDRKYPIVEREAGQSHNFYLGVLFSWGIVGSAFFCMGAGQGLLLARRQGDVFFPAAMFFVLVQGLLDLNINVIEGCIAVFLPLGIVYGRELLRASGLKVPMNADKQ